MTYIYLDVLIITNVYVNYFLLKGTARISHTALTVKRCIIASVLGTLSALMILLPELGLALNLLVKLLCSVIIVRIAFKWSTIKRFAKLTFIFLGISFIFAGVMLTVCDLLKISSIIVQNYSVYFDISVLTLAVSTIVSYIMVCIITYILDKKLNASNSYKVIISLFGKSYTIDAIADTGNSLIDTFSGKPVIICKSHELAMVADINLGDNFDVNDYLEKMKKFRGLRLLPYKTIGNNGIIPAFLAESIFISNEKNQMKPVDAYIGLCVEDKSEDKAIFNPRLLI